jgi:hypothetical protein
MKTKILSLFLFDILLFLGGCSNDSDLSKDKDTASSNTEENENTHISSLIDTKWKLIGFVDAIGTIKTPEPERVDCYWIYFDTDSTFTGKSFTNFLLGSYEIDYHLSTIQINNLGGTEINELFDGKLYIENLLTIHSFSVTDKVLKFFYVKENKEYYLLYKPVSEEINECAWEAVNPVSVSDSFKQELDDVFSENNEIVKNIEGDTLLFVINNDQEFREIGHIGGLSSQAVDFANQTVVWGKILTSSISDKISDKQLSVCSSTNEYKYEVIIEKCTDCWTALGYLYFWGIYPKKINAEDISLVIK